MLEILGKKTILKYYLLLLDSINHIQTVCGKQLGIFQKTAAERIDGPSVYAPLDVDFSCQKALAVANHPAQDNQHR
ncbi:MAG TPA: hypothetical protein PKY20_00335 [Methanothrix sp.]|nr:hypothetical protein [Methanothrix sp.]